MSDAAKENNIELDIVKAPSNKNESKKTSDLLRIAFLSVVLAFVLRLFFIQAFKIPTGSMEDTLLTGDLILVNKLIYGAKTPEYIPLIFLDIPIPQFQFPAIREPEQGDVVVFKFPPDPSIDYIKRCVALPGQTVEIRNKEVFVDGKAFANTSNPVGLKHEDPETIPYDKGYENIYPKGSGSRDNYGPVVVPEGHFFAMGDNRDRSYDSRSWGFVPRDYLIGKAIMIYWSTDLHDNTQIRWYRIARWIE